MIELLSTQRIVTERSGEFYEDVGDYFIEGKWFYQMSPWEWNEVKKQLVQTLVVENQRLVNPIDELDYDSGFILVWKRYKRAYLGQTLVAQSRVVPPGLGKHFKQYYYPFYDRCAVVDWNVDLFPVGKKAKISLWRPEWCEDICGTQNCIIEMFEEGHKLLEMFRDGVLGDPVPELKFVGERKDEYGYDGYVWVFENDTFEEANRILADYEYKSPRNQ